MLHPKKSLQGLPTRQPAAVACPVQQQGDGTKGTRSGAGDLDEPELGH